MMILVVDEEEKARAVFPHLEEIVKEGLLFAKRVEKP
jgi:PII-like signaling protein